MCLCVEKREKRKENVEEKIFLVPLTQVVSPGDSRRGKDPIGTNTPRPFLSAALNALRTWKHPIKLQGEKVLAVLSPQY